MASWDVEVERGWRWPAKNSPLERVYDGSYRIVVTASLTQEDAAALVNQRVYQDPKLSEMYAAMMSGERNDEKVADIAYEMLTQAIEGMLPELPSATPSESK